MVTTLQIKFKVDSTAECKIFKEDCKRRKHTTKKIQPITIHYISVLYALIKNSSHCGAGLQVKNSTFSFAFITEGS